MEKRKSGSRPPKSRAQRRRRIVRTFLCVVLVAVVAAGEYFAVYMAYENMERRKALRLWDCGGSIEANRREPDPVYVEPVMPDVPDSLFEELPEQADIEDFSADADDTEIEEAEPEE